MRALVDPHAGAFLQDLPDPQRRMLLFNEEFTTYLRLRLGRLPYPGVPCPICADGVLDEEGVHQLAGCVKSKHRVRRHDEVVNELVEHAQRAGHQVYKDTSLLLSGTAQRPSDLEIRRFEDGKDASVDVMITHHLAPTYINLAAEGMTRVLVAAEDRKRQKYAALFAGQTAVVFLPFVGTVYGNWGPTAEKVIERIVAAEADALHVKPGRIRWRLYAQLGAILARCNAKAILDRRPTHLLHALARADVL